MPCQWERPGADRLTVLAERFPGAEIVNPATRYRSSAGWLRAWPRLLPTLSALVVFADGDGCIGAGCLHEIADACRVGVPVALLDDGVLQELVSLDLLPPGERGARQTALPVGGDPIEDQVPNCFRADHDPLAVSTSLSETSRYCQTAPDEPSAFT